jgi:hypothetical protein
MALMHQSSLIGKADVLRFCAVEDLLLWRDPKKSGVVFAGATLAYLLLEWSHFSLLSIIANTLLIAVSVAFLWNNIANFTGR